MIFEIDKLLDYNSTNVYKHKFLYDFFEIDKIFGPCNHVYLKLLKNCVTILFTLGCSDNRKRIQTVLCHNQPYFINDC